MPKCGLSRHIIATPHFIEGELEPDKETILYKITALNHVISDEGTDITIHPGMEIFLSDNLPELYEQDKLLTLNNSQYLLIELPLYHIHPGYFEDIIFKLQLKGLIPVIAHPERCRKFIDNPNYVYKLINNGCLMQINSGSLEGFFGKDVKLTALTLIKHNMAHFIASDSHPCPKRTVHMKRGYDIIRKRFGKAAADTLYFGNPGNIINNIPIEAGDPVKITRNKFTLF